MVNLCLCLCAHLTTFDGYVHGSWNLQNGVSYNHITGEYTTASSSNNIGKNAVFSVIDMLYILHIDILLSHPDSFEYSDLCGLDSDVVDLV